MDQDEIVLQKICRNAKSGICMLNRFVEITENDRLKEYTSKKIQEYVKFHDAAEELLYLNGSKSNDVKRLAKKLKEFEENNITEYRYFL